MQSLGNRCCSLLGNSVELLGSLGLLARLHVENEGLVFVGGLFLLGGGSACDLDRCLHLVGLVLQDLAHGDGASFVSQSETT